MAKSRYRTAGTFLGLRGLPRIVNQLRQRMLTGDIPFSQHVLSGNERLDTVAGAVYGDSGYWWLIAIASGIGWGMQVPPGTVLYIPDLELSLRLI